VVQASRVKNSRRDNDDDMTSTRRQTTNYRPHRTRTNTTNELSVSHHVTERRRHAACLRTRVLQATDNSRGRNDNGYAKHLLVHSTVETATNKLDKFAKLQLFYKLVSESCNLSQFIQLIRHVEQFEVDTALSFLIFPMS